MKKIKPIKERKVKAIYWLDTTDEKEKGFYSDGFLYVLEDGTKIYTQGTDIVGHKIVSP